jgi:transcriptional regulator of arginine metabolism
MQKERIVPGSVKKVRQQEILEIIGSLQVSTQQELADEIARRGMAATQSSISRDIVELGLTKVDGHYAAPRRALPADGPITDMDTAGDNLIVVKTRIGQAQPAALAIDNAGIDSIVGTVAGDDTILIAVKNLAAQRAAVKALVRLFSPQQAARSPRPADRPTRPAPEAARTR